MSSRAYKMSDCPSLKTGAVLQYPAQRATRFATQVVRFIDGSEQRFRDYTGPLHRWQVRLDLLDETEMHLVREFFRSEAGSAGTFNFTDPWDGTKYANCSFEQDDLAEEMLDEMKERVSIGIRENRG